MRPLATTLRKGGLALTLVRRNGKAAIYRQHAPSGNPDNDAYEVILPRVLNTDFNGQPVEPHESYPESEAWGNRGWTFKTLSEAQRKVEKVSQKAARSQKGLRRNRFDAVLGSREGVIANDHGKHRNGTKQP